MPSEIQNSEPFPWCFNSSICGAPMAKTEEALNMMHVKSRLMSFGLMSDHDLKAYSMFFLNV